MNKSSKPKISPHPIMRVFAECGAVELVGIHGFISGETGSDDDRKVIVFTGLDRAVSMEIPLDRIAYVETAQAALDPSVLFVDAEAEIRTVEHRTAFAKARDVCIGCVPDLSSETDFCHRIAAMISDLEFELEHGDLSADQSRKTKKALATARYAERLLCSRSTGGIV